SVRFTVWSRFRFFFQAEDGIRGGHVTGVQTCALPISEIVNGFQRAVGCMGLVLQRLQLLHNFRDEPVFLARAGMDVAAKLSHLRSEERRVGKECRSWWWANQ